MKILILNLRDHKHPRAGGAEHFTHEVAKRWVADGHSVTKITSNFEFGANTEVVDGVDIIRMGSYFTVRRKARQHYKKHLKGRFDVVVDEYTNIPFLAPRFFQEPVILLVFEVVGKKYIIGLPPVVGHFAHYWLEPRWYRYYRGTKTVTISSSTANDLRDLGLSDVEIVPVGINHSSLECLPRKEDAPTFLFVGLLKKVNRVQDVIKAFRLIAAEIPEATLWVVGRGSELGKLKKLARGLPVQFFGYVDDELKFDLMKRAHVVLVPGIREGWGMVITEANSCGTPVIGYNIVGHKDAIRHGETGLLTESTPQAMARAAIRVAKDEGLRNRLSCNALEWSRQFSWDKAASEFMAIIESQCSIHMHKVLQTDQNHVPRLAREDS